MLSAGGMVALYSSFSAADATPPITNITLGPSVSKVSDEVGFNSTDLSFTVDEACQAYKVKIVPATSSVHTAGTQVEAGGAIASGGTVNITLTYAELAAASAVEGSNIIKIFVQDTAGNWST